MIYKSYIRKELNEYCKKKNYTQSTRLINFYFEVQDILKSSRFDLVQYLVYISEYGNITIKELVEGSGRKYKRLRTLFVIYCRSNTDYSNREISEIIGLDRSTVSELYSAYNQRGDREYEKFKIWLNDLSDK